MGYIGSVRFYKNMILLAVIIMIAVPSCMSIRLKQDLAQTSRELESQKQQVEQLQAAAEQEPVIAEPAAQEPDKLYIQAESPYMDLYPDFYAPQELTANQKTDGIIYLTFDDGPSARTGEILDILKEKEVKATFFVVGTDSEAEAEMLRRIVAEGHTLGMHSFSHKYDVIYDSVDAYLADMYQLFVQIRDTTGVAPTLFRFPGGSISRYNSGIYQDLISEMMRRGFVPHDWNLSSQDASSTLLSSGRLVSNVLSGIEKVDRGIVLMHDSSHHTTTVQALSPLIDQLREKGFELEALTPDVLPVLYAYKN